MKIFGDNVLSLYICTQTIKGFYVYLLSSFYIGVRSFVKSTGSSSFFHQLCAAVAVAPTSGQRKREQRKIPVDLHFIVRPKD